MKRSWRIIALAVGIFALVLAIIPFRSQDVPSEEPASAENTVYRFTLYCSRLYCNDLQDVNAEQLDSISKAISDIGPSGVEIKACEWTVFNCSLTAHDEFRAVVRNLAGTVLLMRLGERTFAGGPTVGATDEAPETQQDFTNESTIVVPSAPKAAVERAIR
jgi:hypothetical protein